MERLAVNDVADEVLVGRVARSEDERALSELYDRYAGLIYGAGLRYLGDRALAEDLVQDVFTAVWQNASGFDPGRASFATWVVPHHAQPGDGPDPPPQSQGPDRGWQPSLRAGGGGPDGRALAKLRPGVGSLAALAGTGVLTLAYFRGLSQSEISRHTDTPLGTVKSRTTAALRALRQTMLEDETG